MNAFFEEAGMTCLRDDPDDREAMSYGIGVDSALSRRKFLSLAGTGSVTAWIALGSAGTLLAACSGSDEVQSSPGPSNAAAIPFAKGLHDLGGDVYAYLQPDGGWGLSNAGLVVRGDATLVVDTLADPRLAREMLAAMRAQVPAASHIDTVVNTHADGDHTFGNQSVSDAQIVSSATTATDMANAISPAMLAAYLANPPPGPEGEFARVALPFRYDDIKVTLPTRTFTGHLELPVGNRSVTLTEFGPAHTHSDVIVHVPDAAVVFAGDLLTNHVHPLISVGPIKNWQTSLDRILDLKARLIVPGHGAVADAATVDEFRGYLKWVTDEAMSRHAAGMTPLDAARSILDTQNPYSAWLAPERMVVNVTTVYRDLGDNPPSDMFRDLFPLMASLWSEIHS